MSVDWLLKWLLRVALLFHGYAVLFYDMHAFMFMLFVAMHFEDTRLLLKDLEQSVLNPFGRRFDRRKLVLKNHEHCAQ